MKIDTEATGDVLLAYVHNGSVASCFMDSVLAAFAEDARRPQRRLIEYFQAGGPYIHDNRSRVARYMLECTDRQWLWFLDNDMDFPIDTLYRLLDAAETHQCGILGAAYWNQYSGSDCLLSWLLFTPGGIRAIRNLPDQEEPFQVDAVGMGCTLIHRDVLQDVADMYPNDPWDTYAADMLVRFEDGGFFTARTPDDFDPKVIEERGIAETSRMGEDVSFCLRARKAGYLTHGLPSLVAEHFKPHFMAHGRQEAIGASNHAEAHTDRRKEDLTHAAV